MAEERKTFKWGDQEYLLDDLLKLHAAQENNYYDFAKTRGQYDDNALQGLRQAITNRINAVKSGEAFEGDGVLSTDIADNTRIQTQKKGLFRKEKYVDQDNTEWAKYYLNKLVGNLKPYKEATSDKGSWDITKHGLQAYLTGQGLNAQEIFEKQDLRDENNPEAARSFTQRHDLLRKQLTGYRDWLASKGFDFTKNDNEWDDNFLSDLNNLVNSEQFDNNTLAASLRKLGAGDGFTTAFTSDKWDLSKSQGELDAEAKKRKEEEEAKLKEQHMKEAQDYFHSQKRQSNAIYATPFNYSNHKFKEGVEANFADWYNDLNASERLKYGTHLGRDSKAWGSAWNQLMNSLKSGQQYTDKNLGVLLQGTFETQPQQFRDLGDGNYLIMDSITDSGQGTVYNPNSGYMDTVFLGDIADRNTDIMNVYKNLAYKYANNKYNTNYENKRYLFKEGGEIPKYQYGNSVNYNWDSNNKAIESRAKSNDNTVDQQKARERYIDSDNKSVDNPDAGFTGAELARLGTIAADITSMFLDPISGTAVGLGSSLVNFGADIADDGFQWSDVGNLGINAGFDLLGAIPIFGDAVGTGTKITRKLVKWAPRIMAGLAAYQGVANFDGMMNSWSKMTSSDAKMTVQDWRNIAQSIGLVTGATRAIKNKAAQNSMKKQAKVDGVVSVNVRNKNTGEIEQLLVDGKAAEAIKKNKNNIAEIEKTLSEIEGFQGKFGEGGNYEINLKKGGWQSPIGRSKDELEGGSWELRGFRKDGVADVNNYYDFSRVRGYSNNMGYSLPFAKKWTDAINNWHKEGVKALNKPHQIGQDLQGKMTGSEIDDQFKQLLKDNGIDDQITALNTEMASRTAYQTSAKDKLAKAQAELQANADRTKNLASEQELNANRASYEQELRNLPDDMVIRDAENAIAHNQSVIARNKEKRQQLSESRSQDLQQMEEGMKARIQQKRANIAKMKEARKRLEKLKAKGTIGPRQQKTLDNLPQNIKEAEKDLRDTKKALKSNKTLIINQNQRAYTRLAADTKKAKRNIATAQPIAVQRAELNKYKAKLKGVDADLATHADVNAKNTSIQQRINNWQNYLTARNPQTAHTNAYTQLETMLNNLSTQHSQIGGRTLDWDMKSILDKYGVKNAFKEGGSINRNKINKFLNYAKG